MDYINGRPTPYDDHGARHRASRRSPWATGSGPVRAPGSMKGVAPAAHLSAAKVLDASGSGDDSSASSDPVVRGPGERRTSISLSLGSDVPSDGLDGLLAGGGRRRC